MSKFESWFLFFLLTLIPSQLSYHFWLPEFANPRIDYLSLTVYFTDLIAVLILFIRFVSGRLTVFSRLEKHSYYFVFILLIALTNVCFSLSPLLSLWKFSQILLYSALFSEYSWLKPPSSNILRHSLLVTVSWISLIALTQFSLSRSLGGAFYWLGERPLSLSVAGISHTSLPILGLKLRPYSTFPHPNALAGFLVISLPLLFAYYDSKSSNQRLLNIVIGIVILALITTFSVSALLVFAVYLALRFYKYRSYRLPFTISLVVLVCTLFLKPISYFDRIDLLKESITTFFLRPLFGTGLGAYLAGVQNPISPLGSFYQPVHNLFILFCCEVGLVGVTSTILLVKKYLRVSSFSLVDSYPLSLAMVTALGFFDHYWLTSHSNLLFVVLLLVIFFQKNVRFVKH